MDFCDHLLAGVQLNIAVVVVVHVGEGACWQ
jgi:hypothetical protein